MSKVMKLRLHFKQKSKSKVKRIFFFVCYYVDMRTFSYSKYKSKFHNIRLRYIILD